MRQYKHGVELILPTVVPDFQNRAGVLPLHAAAAPALPISLALQAVFVLLPFAPEYFDALYLRFLSG
jgi:hypothetical protein